ncbi:SACS-like protein [Mya arenaria]|uniref:SACS-like protein n=1 Tax=Mya arenaria TaxID=6604 RepID=A0ABY7EQA5_MYAAR|nr:SACS-like protein [Mya arenaria]
MEADVVKKKKPVISSFKQPTVIEQLKYILAEYPDGGQILKAPALCVHNDAEFAEQDWKGIIMIYNSVKKFDILKVGRFGLGFKSVFHLTDNPCIISGKRMLLMDPLHPAGCEPAPMEIGDLGEMEGFYTNAFIQALDGKFGFNRETLSSGYFRGTLFWFPLREIPTTLSDNVYTVEKVMNLFRAFQQDSSSILLFLKSLSEVTLFTDNQSQPPERKVYAKVKIADSGVKCLAQRATFAYKVSNRFVIATLSSKSDIAFQSIIEEGSYHISNFSSDALRTFLRESLQAFEDKDMDNSSKISLLWLEKVWSLVTKHGLERFKDLRLLPLLQEGTFDGTYVVKLVPLTYPYVLSDLNNISKGMNGNVKKALQLLGITVLEDLPNWLPKRHLNGYVSQLNHYELKRCFDTIEEDNVLAVRTIFNSKADDETRKDFVKYLCYSEEDYGMSFLEELEIFKMISKTKGCEKYAKLKLAGI